MLNSIWHIWWCRTSDSFKNFPALALLKSQQVNVEFLFVLEFYSPVNNEVMSSQSVISCTVPGQALKFLAVNQY